MSTTTETEEEHLLALLPKSEKEVVVFLTQKKRSQKVVEAKILELKTANSIFIVLRFYDDEDLCDLVAERCRFNEMTTSAVIKLIADSQHVKFIECVIKYIKEYRTDLLLEAKKILQENHLKQEVAESISPNLKPKKRGFSFIAKKAVQFIKKNGLQLFGKVREMKKEQAPKGGEYQLTQA